MGQKSLCPYTSSGLSWKDVVTANAEWGFSSSFSSLTLLGQKQQICPPQKGGLQALKGDCPPGAEWLKGNPALPLAAPGAQEAHSKWGPKRRVSRALDLRHSYTQGSGLG